MNTNKIGDIISVRERVDENEQGESYGYFSDVKVLDFTDPFSAMEKRAIRNGSVTYFCYARGREEIRMNNEPEE